MIDFWNHFRTNRYWFIGTLLALLIISLFIWSLIDYNDFVFKVNRFLNDMIEIFKCLLMVTVVIIAARYFLFKSKPAKKSSSGH
jgi:hypothetical protein